MDNYFEFVDNLLYFRPNTNTATIWYFITFCITYTRTPKSSSDSFIFCLLTLFCLEFCFIYMLKNVPSVVISNSALPYTTQKFSILERLLLYFMTSLWRKKIPSNKINVFRSRSAVNHFFECCWVSKK